jgi:hypothetical protein
MFQKPFIKTSSINVQKLIVLSWVANDLHSFSDASKLINYAVSKITAL